MKHDEKRAQITDLGEEPPELAGWEKERQPTARQAQGRGRRNKPGACRETKTTRGGALDSCLKSSTRKEEAKERTVYNKQAMGVFWKCDPSNWGKSHPELLKKEGAKKKQRPQHKPTR